MALDAVAAAEGLTISDEELEAEYKSMAEQYGMDVDKVKEAAPAEDVKTTLLRRKALELVKAEAKPEAPKAPEEEKSAEEAEEKPAPKKRAPRSKKGTAAPSSAEAAEQE